MLFVYAVPLQGHTDSTNLNFAQDILLLGSAAWLLADFVGIALWYGACAEMKFQTEEENMAAVFAALLGGLALWGFIAAENSAKHEGPAKLSSDAAHNIAIDAKWNVAPHSVYDYDEHFNVFWACTGLTTDTITSITNGGYSIRVSDNFGRADDLVPNDAAFTSPMTARRAPGTQEDIVYGVSMEDKHGIGTGCIKLSAPPSVDKRWAIMLTIFRGADVVYRKRVSINTSS
jgi:hypothetical protein